MISRVDRYAMRSGSTATCASPRCPSTARQSPKPLSRNSRCDVSPASVIDGLSGRGRSGPTAWSAIGPAPRRRTGARTGGGRRAPAGWRAAGWPRRRGPASRRRLPCAGRRCPSRRGRSRRRRRGPALSTRRTPSGRSSSTVRCPGFCSRPMAVQCVSGSGSAGARASASCLAAGFCATPSRGSRAITAATRSVMIRCASTTSRSDTGISAAPVNSASRRPRSVSRSAQISTAARDLSLPRYARPRRSSSCSSAGWLLTRVTAAMVCVDDLGAQPGELGAQLPLGQLGEGADADAGHAQRREHLADVSGQRRPGR